jgi:hypothetical protein
MPSTRMLHDIQAYSKHTKTMRAARRERKSEGLRMIGDFQASVEQESDGMCANVDDTIYGTRDRWTAHE